MRSTHVCEVEGVGELDGVAGGGPHVDLVLRDELRAVKVVLLRNEGKGRDEDGGVRVRDAVAGQKLSARSAGDASRKNLQHGEVRVRRRLAGPGHNVVGVGNCGATPSGEG